MRNILLLGLLAVLLTGCKKEDENNISPIVGTWHVVAYETRAGNANWTTSVGTCRLDDIEEYEANGRWTLYDGTDQCEAGTGITRGTWELRASNTKIVYTYDAFDGEYESTVEELSDSRLVISWSAGDLDNTQYRLTFRKE